MRCGARNVYDAHNAQRRVIIRSLGNARQRTRFFLGRCWPKGGWSRPKGPPTCGAGPARVTQGPRCSHAGLRMALVGSTLVGSKATVIFVIFVWFHVMSIDVGIVFHESTRTLEYLPIHHTQMGRPRLTIGQATQLFSNVNHALCYLMHCQNQCCQGSAPHWIEPRRTQLDCVLASASK